MGRFHYEPSVGDDVYRRSVYTFWRRSVAPTTLFDAAKRRVCTTRIVRTNTPLHALTLMNDTTYIEAARVLAEHAMREALEFEDRVQIIVTRVLGRPADLVESVALLRQLQTTLDYYVDHPKEAAALIGQGQAPVDETLAAPELAAYTALANTVLNLDEAITHE